MKNTIKLDPRLSAAAAFVRDGAVIADVGTDHGYIPISLLLSGKCPFAYATDVNRMPLERARENARRCGVDGRMVAVRSDGLRFIDELTSAGDERPIDDIVICGMGGELIARILDESKYVRRSDVGLIMQPMTMADKLRTFLAESGFRTLDERLVAAAGKTYAVIRAEYDGIARRIGAAEALLGERNIERGGELFENYVREHIAKLGGKIAGLERGGHDASAERALLEEMKTILNRADGVK